MNFRNKLYLILSYIINSFTVRFSFYYLYYLEFSVCLLVFIKNGQFFKRKSKLVSLNNVQRGNVRMMRKKMLKLMVRETSVESRKK